MVYSGHYENGVVVFDELPGLPDGTEVEVHVINSEGLKKEDGPILDEHG